MQAWLEAGECDSVSGHISSIPTSEYTCKLVNRKFRPDVALKTNTHVKKKKTRLLLAISY